MAFFNKILMTRQELYNSIDRCGGLPYLPMRYLISNVRFANESIRVTLLERLANNNGGFSQSDWVVFFNQISFMQGSPVNTQIAIDWITGKCNLTYTELQTILEYVVFTDNSAPTYTLLGENNQILISE